jgi:hypothetical protein
MIRILEIDQPFASRLFHQFAHHLLPDPPALVVEQPTVTGLIGGPNVMRQILPTATRREDIQNAIEHFALIAPGATRGRWFWQQPFETFPLEVG